MIYKFIIKQSKKRDADHDITFYMTADNEKALYKRAADTYGVPIQDIEVLEEIDDSLLDINTSNFGKKRKKDEQQVSERTTTKTKTRSKSK